MRQEPLFGTWLGLAVCIGVCLGVGAVGALFTRTSLADWYVELRKPTWNPPAWLFGPVWTLLYLAMATAAWLVWRKAGFAGAAWPLGLFGVQMGLNLLWSVLFFGSRSPASAAVEIVLLWAAIAATLISFLRIDRLAAALLAPYLAWVTFAALLNVAIWRLNRSH